MSKASSSFTVAVTLLVREFFSAHVSVGPLTGITGVVQCCTTGITRSLLAEVHHTPFGREYHRTYHVVMRSVTVYIYIYVCVQGTTYDVY